MEMSNCLDKTEKGNMGLMYTVMRKYQFKMIIKNYENIYIYFCNCIFIYINNYIVTIIIKKNKKIIKKM